MIDEIRETPPSDGPNVALGALVVLLVVTAFAFMPGLDAQFVYDDHRFIPENHAIRDLGNLPRFFTDVSTMTATQGVEGWNDIYRPLRTLSYALDWALFGDNAFWYRLESVLWHLLAVFLAWLLLARLLDSPLLAVLGAGVFALHPLQSQTVSWISSRGDLLGAAALLGAAILLLRPEPGRLRSVGGVALYALALLGKESTVALLGLVVLHDWLLVPRPLPRRWLGRRLVLYGALGAVTLVFLAFRFRLATGQLPWEQWATLCRAGSATLLLLGQTVFPIQLLPYTGDVLHHEQIEVWFGGVAFLVIGSGAILAFCYGRRWPLPAFGFLWAAVALAPVSGLIPLKTLAENRFAYLPLLGVGLLLALLVRRSGRLGLGLGTAVLLLLGVAAARESRTWSSDREMWETAVAREDAVFGVPGDVALANLGNARARDGDLDLAEAALRRSLALRETAQTWANLALVLFDRGNREGAIAAARNGVARDPYDAPARERLGTLLIETGDLREAIEQLETALKIYPQFHIALGNLGYAYLQAGRIPDAVGCLREAVRLAPYATWIRLRLGEAHLAGGRLDEALSTFQEAAAREPGNPAPLLWMGRTYLAASRFQDALRALDRCLALDRRNPAAAGERLAAMAALEGGLSDEGVDELRRCAADMEQRRWTSDLIAVLGRPSLWRLGIPDVRLQLVRVLLETGDLERAYDRLREMEAATPEDRYVLANLGLVELKLGRHRAAADHLGAAIEKDPGSFLLRMSLARALLAEGQRDEARTEARAALECAHDDAEASEARLFLAELR